MPLITFTGLPCSGKTAWAARLAAQLEARIAEARAAGAAGGSYAVEVISDDSLGISRSDYRESATEKTARGAQMAAVKRLLSRTTLVILDSLCYIKGFRYQLYCEAKGVVTPHCVVHVMCPLEQCIEWNDKWDSDVIRQVAMRYEEPSANSRWDSPLFTVVSGVDELLPLNQIWDALVLSRAPAPNAATLVKPTLGNDTLQQLNKVTHDVVAAVAGQYGSVSVPGCGTVTLPPEPVAAAQLQRIRRTFIALNKMRNVAPDRIGPLFVEYLNAALE